MQQTAGAGIRGRHRGHLALQNAVDAAGSESAKLERLLQNVGLKDGAHHNDGSSGRIGGGQGAVPPAMPPDEPGAMTEQALERWSLTDLVGVPRLGRLFNLLSAVQRTAG